MNNYDNFSVKVKNYKCFGEEEAGFDKIKPINVIIGKNNSGKSSLLDVIQFITNPSNNINILGHNGKIPEIILKDELNQNELQRVFSVSTSGGDLRTNHWVYGNRFISKIIKWKLFIDPLYGEKRTEFINIDTEIDYSDGIKYFNDLVSTKVYPLKSLEFIKLNSERNILTEFENSSEIIDSNGNGCTNLYNIFLNNANKANYLINKNILDALNYIFEPESNFIEINTLRIEEKKWELFLTEDKKGKIALSQSGSSLKTILLVLANIFLIPNVKRKKLKDFIFAFEELENNLHPSLQRKLFLFLRKIAIEEDTTFFITTHSNVVIDLFSNDNESQIIHIVHDGESARTKTVYNYKDNKGIIDDLDLRASDLLQSNCIIWVEGPSDRIYLNKWIELLTKGTLKENYHYQCVFYGGRLLAHLSASSPDDNIDNLVKIFSVNRNSILIMDSDKKTENGDINETKKRIKKELELSGGYAWITFGNEIENYIPSKTIEDYLDLKDLPSLDRFSELSEYLNKVKDNQGNIFLKSKVIFAENISKFFTLDSIKENEDLLNNLTEVIDRIKKCNGI